MAYSGFLAGQIITTAQLNEAVGETQSYTPVWTAATTNPTIGNGSLTGAWTRVGDIVAFGIILTWGSTTTNGSGNYAITLPVPAGPLAIGEVVGQATTMGTGGTGGRTPIICQYGSNGTNFSMYGPRTNTVASMNYQQIDANGLLSAVWSSTASIRVSGTYIAA